MDHQEKITALREFFDNETENILSDEDLEALLRLTYPNRHVILDFEDENTRIEVLALFRKFPFTDVMDYLSNAVNFEDLVLNSPLMADARKAVKEKREILSRDLPGAKIGPGKCPHCGHDEILRTEVQTASADEPMRIIEECTQCRRIKRG